MLMKPFENYKVAVCISGQSRTYKHCAESIKQFFSSDRNNQFYYFGHIWTHNNISSPNDPYGWSLSPALLDPAALAIGLRANFNFEKLEIEGPRQHRNTVSVPSDDMLYSILKCNMLKQMYEVENNMMFDLVVRIRSDLIFTPGVRFENILRELITNKTLYAYFGHMNAEYCLPNPNECMYFGTSFTMDLIDSLYKAVSSNTLYTLSNSSQDNPVLYHVGAGALLYKWATLKNCLIRHVEFQPTIFRERAIGMDPVRDFNKIREMQWTR
jgi:hypothetical protein